jgi:tripartite ATP-independent transporter DctM subunit
MAGGVLASLIPPSIMMIIYGYIARISIGKLFMGGVLPGFITAAMYIIYVLVRCYLRPELAPKTAVTVTWKKRWASLKYIVAPSLLVVAVLGSIFSGMATPTEASAIGASGAFVICLIHRRMNWQVLTDSCIETMKISGMALWILVTATLFGVVYTNAGAQDMVLNIVTQLHVSRWFVLAIMQMVLLLFGMFMDDYAVITICAPIFTPITQALGFDPLWFAIVFILNMQVAYLSPPFGWALILMKGVAPPEVTTRDIWTSVPPFVAVQLCVLVATLVFPGMALWLPSKVL